jgi:hypothetical protein
MSAEPSVANDFLAEHARLLCDSYRRRSGRDLIDPALDEAAAARALFEADFAVVSHGTESDPIFNYGNRKALELFGMAWRDFIRLPSRLSAEPVNREERERLLRRVTTHGFIDDYSGVRIAANGQRFMIENATVWNVDDDTGAYRGQAAMFAEWQNL